MASLLNSSLSTIQNIETKCSSQRVSTSSTDLEFEVLSDDHKVQRRNFVVGSSLATLLLSVTNSSLAEVDLSTVTGPEYSFNVPSNWEKGQGKTGQQDIVAYFPLGESDSTNVNLVITFLGADFTSMGSFGTAETFAEHLVNTQDRSWKKPPGQAVKLVSVKGTKDMYFVEYTVQKVGGPKRHLFSAIGVYDNGRYNRLYTLTGQFLEDESEKYKETISKVINSFKLSKKEA